MRSMRGRDKPPATDGPQPRARRHRILKLFAPYKSRLSAAMALIAFSAGISMISPFLLREVVNVGLIQHNNTVLA